MPKTRQNTAHPQHLLLSLVLLFSMTSLGGADLFTSTEKITELANLEGKLLDSLNAYISNEYNNLRHLSQFLSERSWALLRSSPQDEALHLHPNAVLLLIKHYVTNWNWLRDRYAGLAQQLTSEQWQLPNRTDLDGSLSALVRLQRVYGLRASDMYAGNYSGYVGPGLRPEDAFLVGRQAFLDGYLPHAVDWLQLAVTELNPDRPESPCKPPHESPPPPLMKLDASYLQAVALLGRAYLYSGMKKKAEEMLHISMPLDPLRKLGDVVSLEADMDSGNTFYGHSNQTWDANMTLLCSRDRHQTVSRVAPWHVCRYRSVSGAPYVRFAEEILSVRPFASLIHHFATDTEMEHVKSQVKGKMYRGMVGENDIAKVGSARTSDLGWLHDYESTVVARLSSRVKLATGLEVDQRGLEGPSSAEPMQLVNYGLGGHYDAHLDPHKYPPHGHTQLKNSGTRIATFLIYLSDVKKGGSTVFLKSGISVAPVKGMALFWYNYAPDMTLEDLTQHAGCPVLEGHKWIANKWIWTYGNTFRRPCGSDPHASQLDVERLLQQQHDARTLSSS